MTADGL